MSKMGLHDPIEHFIHKLWPNERSGVKLAIWFLTTKNQESPRFPYVQVGATYCWKALEKGYNFSLDFISIGRLHTKLWAPKIARVSTLRISGLPFRSPETKWHLGVGLVVRHIIKYKEEGGGFPQVRVVVSFVSSCLLVVSLCSKVFQLRINQLVVWFV
jgi:hypothetical protein